MTFTRYAPSRHSIALQRQIDRLFNEVLPAPVQVSDRCLFSPPVEISETEKTIEVKVELPGVDGRDIEVQVTKEMLSIRGERKPNPESEGVGMSEFRYGKFGRLLSLPAQVNNTAVTADYKDGILWLTLPKAETEPDKVVKVNLG